MINLITNIPLYTVFLVLFFSKSLSIKHLRKFEVLQKAILKQFSNLYIISGISIGETSDQLPRFNCSFVMYRITDESVHLNTLKRPLMLFKGKPLWGEHMWYNSFKSIMLKFKYLISLKLKPQIS